MVKQNFYYSVRIRFADTDPMGVVYHAKYFEWFEAARTELIRANGMSYKDLDEMGLSLPVIEAYCRYRQAVIYDELIRIKTCLAHFNRVKLRLEYQVFGENDQELRIDGYTVHCFTDSRGKPVRAPEEIIHLFQRIQCQ